MTEQNQEPATGDSVHVRIERDVLAEAVTWTARSLPQRPASPVLTGMLLEASTEGVVRLSAFDYEVSARVEIPAEVETAGRVLVSGRLLADIIRSLPNRPVVLESSGPKVDLTCGSSHFTLAKMAVDSYPALPTLPETSGSLAGSEFSEAVAQVTIASSKDDTLPILTGVRVEIEGEKMTLLATDRYRLAVRELTWRPSSPDFSAAALVRGRTLSEVAKAMGGEIALSLTDGQGADLIGFEAGGRASTSLLVEGEYPKVRSLFPDQVLIHSAVEKAPLLEAVRRVSLVAERNTPIRFIFTSDQVVLQAGTGDDAQASEVVPCRTNGEDITVGFNPQFILDGLGAVDAPFVRFSFTQPMKSVVITGQREVDGEDDPSYRYLIMPIRI